MAQASNETGIQSYKPAHKILWASLIASILIATAIFAVKGKTVEVIKEKDPQNSAHIGIISSGVAEKRLENASVDSDGDGLEDWEEALWGTDTKNRDTDNDTTSDGDEIKQNRDPLTPGPNDVFSDKEAIEKLRKENQEIENLTTTERFSRTLLAKYLLFKRTGAELDEASRDELINSTIQSTGASVIYPKWQKSDFTVITNPTSQQIRNYGNTLGRILKENSPEKPENELYILAKIVSDEDYTDVPKLVEMADSYKKIIDSYKQVAVPSSGIDQHLALMNALSRMEADIRAFSQVESDPVMMLGYVGAHSDTIDMFIEALRGSITYLSSGGITYEQSEPGYTFTQSVR